MKVYNPLSSCAVLVILAHPLGAAAITGVINRAADGMPVENVRVTLFRPDLRFFREVSITPGVRPPPTRPAVTVTATDASGSEPANAITFLLARTGATTAPLAVPITVSGTALRGADFTGLPEPAVIAAGQSNLTITLMPVNDSLPEVPKTISLSVPVNVGFIQGIPSIAMATLSDDDGTPAAPALQFAGGSSTLFQLDFTGAALTDYQLDYSANLLDWSISTQLPTDTGLARLMDAMTPLRGFFRVRPHP